MAGASQLHRQRASGQRGGPSLKLWLFAIATITLIVALSERATHLARVQSNEQRVLRLLTQVATYESLFRSARVRDADADGNGEFGFLQEISGVEPIASVQMPGGHWLPGGISNGLVQRLGRAVHEGGGVAQQDGYRITLYLYDEEVAVRESVPLPAPPAAEDTMRLRTRERRWTVYAWPEAYGRTGRRTFCVAEDGIIAAHDARGEHSGDRAPDDATIHTLAWKEVRDLKSQ